MIVYTSRVWGGSESIVSAKYLQTLFKKFFLFIYFWLYLGLCCCTNFLQMQQVGLLLVAAHRLLTAVTFLVAEHGL